MLSEYSNICAICGKPATEIHHLVFGRGMRELADEDGLTISLCRECHENAHKNESWWSKSLGQMEFEIQRVAQGIPQEVAREQFRKRYGRSYL